MKEKQQKRWHLPVLFLFLFYSLLLFGGCSSEKAEKIIENPGIKVTFFDVGKGDAILIETAKERMLIDTGYDNTSDVILDYLKKEDISYVDYLVLTHFDKDHVGGADKILEAMDVGVILQPDYEADSSQYEEYQEAVQTMGIRPELVTETLEMPLGEATCLVYPPQQEEYEEEDNDFSLVISITYGRRRFLFAGDCERVRLDELLGQAEFALSHDLLKVPHHGKKEKNLGEFLEMVAPQIAVITCSQEKPPEEEVEEMLQDLGAEVYLTSGGTVVCTSDGDTIQVFQG